MLENHMVLEPERLPDSLWHAQQRAIAAENAAYEQVTCGCPTCDEPAYGSCDECDQRFCSDHGTKGGDRQIQDVGAVAHPSLCWNCGGFDADEGDENYDAPLTDDDVSQETSEDFCDFCGAPQPCSKSACIGALTAIADYHEGTIEEQS